MRDSWLKVAQIDKITGEIIKEYVSVNTAEKENKLKHIHAVCLGSRKTCGGYMWKYI